MIYDKEVLEIFDRLKIFKELYEQIRFVDPLRKKVLIYKDDILTEFDSNCYDTWNKNKLCMNCTSMRALNENKTFIKMEHNLGEIYMVTSIPLKLADRNIVVELLKDASFSMGFESCDGTSKSSMYSVIDSMNSILLKDPLTNIYNRRYINEILPVDIIISTISNGDLSIVIADIDLFKKVNDTYGHLAGDTVLKEFVNILEECMEGSDGWIARYGGEEILIGIHRLPKDKVIELVEIMRKSVEDNTFYHNGMNIKITASFGVCSIKDVEDCNISNFIDCADKKLYIAKDGGRNRVEF